MMNEFEKMLLERAQGVSNIQRAPALQRDPTVYAELDRQLSEVETARRQAVADTQAVDYIAALKSGKGLLAKKTGTEKISTIVDKNINDGAKLAGVIDARTKKAAAQNMLQAALGAPTKAPTFLDTLLRVGSGMGQTPGVSFASDFIGSSQRDRARTAATAEKQANRAIQEADLAAKQIAAQERADREERTVKAAENKFIYGSLTSAQQEAQNEIVRDLLQRNEGLKSKVKTGGLGVGEQAITSIASIYTQLQRKAAGTKTPDQLLEEAVSIVTGYNKAADPVVDTGLGPNTIIIKPKATR